MRIGWGSGSEGLTVKLDELEDEEGGQRGADGEERCTPCDEATDEAPRVPGEPLLPDGRGTPQH